MNHCTGSKGQPEMQPEAVAGSLQPLTITHLIHPVHLDTELASEAPD